MEGERLQGSRLDRMRKLWCGALVGLLLLSGCASDPVKSTSASSSKATQRSKVTTSRAKTVKRTSSSATSAKTAASATAKSATSKSAAKAASAQTTVWNATKRQQLATFMHGWQRKMGQNYQGTYDGQVPNHLGFKFPAAIKNGSLNGRLKWGSQKISVSWSTTGTSSAAYQVLEVATGGKPNEEWPTTYLFCLHQQRPVVLMTQTTNGDTLYVQDTQNAALQSGFAGIVTGNRPAVLSNASLNADVASVLKANRLPQAYRGNWYWYDQQQRRVRHFNAVETPKMTVYDGGSATSRIVVSGARAQTGTGMRETVRYEYYDGRQIPVMMMGSNDHVFFGGNAYHDQNVANQLRQTEYGDEIKTN